MDIFLDRTTLQIVIQENLKTKTTNSIEEFIVKKKKLSN